MNQIGRRARLAAWRRRTLFLASTLAIATGCNGGGGSGGADASAPDGDIHDIDGGGAGNTGGSANGASSGRNSSASTGSSTSGTTGGGTNGGTTGTSTGSNTGTNTGSSTGGNSSDGGASGGNNSGSGMDASVDNEGGIREDASLSQDAAADDASTSADAGPDAGGGSCGDGVQNGDEQCDLGTANNTGAYGGCNANCTRADYCGDGTKNGSEACDLGTVNNTGAYGGCSANCTRADYCGDGTKNGSEACDLGTANNTGAYGGCNANCSLADYCGDGVVDSSEDCDKGGDNSDALLSGCSTGCEYTSLVAWFDATDVLGDGGAVGDGELVTSWADKARDNDATQSTQAMRPSFVADGIGGAPALLFDGANDFMSVPVNVDATVISQLTIIAVYQNGAGNAATYAGVWGQDNGGWDRFMVSGGMAGRGISGGSGFVDVPDLYSEGEPLLSVATLSNEASSAVHVNGVLSAQFSESHSNAGDTLLSIGDLNGPSSAIVGTGQGSFDGLIAELLIFDHALTDAERNEIGSALAAKYNLAAYCGDTDVQSSEECDDGVNDGSYGGCNTDCTLAPYCGDAVKNGSETCDLGSSNNTGAYGGCNQDCTLAAYCGDGTKNGAEGCDLGTDNNTGVYGGCTANCTLAAYCGDGIKNGSEECDTAGESAACDGSCVSLATLTADVRLHCDGSSTILQSLSGAACHNMSTPTINGGASWLSITSSNTRAILYKNADCTGSSVTISGAETNFCSTSFDGGGGTNDKVRSIKLITP